MQKKVYFYNSRKEKLCGILFRPKGPGKVPGIVFCHGFASSKGSKISIARKICKNGFAVLIFDASGHGESGGKFEDHTITKYVGEVKNAVEFLKNQKFVDSKRIGITGTSLGGMVSVIYASKHKPKAIISVCAPTALTKFIGNESLMQKNFIEEWKKKGFATFAVRIKEDKRAPRILSYNFMKDGMKYNLAKTVKKVRCPIIIVHGNADKNVLLDHAYILFRNANMPKEMVIIEGAAHTFKGEYENILAKIIINGFKKFL